MEVLPGSAHLFFNYLFTIWTISHLPFSYCRNCRFCLKGEFQFCLSGALRSTTGFERDGGCANYVKSTGNRLRSYQRRWHSNKVKIGLFDYFNSLVFVFENLIIFCNWIANDFCDKSEYTRIPLTFRNHLWQVWCQVWLINMSLDRRSHPTSGLRPSRRGPD